MAVSDDEYSYASEDEDEGKEDSDDSGNESSIAGDSLQPDEVNVITDSGIEEDGVLVEGYRPRRPPGLLEAGFIRMTTHLGAPGIFDPKTMLVFIRAGAAERYKGLHWKGFQCACSKITPRARPQGSSGCKLSYYQRHDHRHPDHHRPLTIHQLQLARYSLCQRAFFLLRHSGIKIAEWNFFSQYTWCASLEMLPAFGTKHGSPPISKRVRTVGSFFPSKSTCTCCGSSYAACLPSGFDTMPTCSRPYLILRTSILAS